MSKKILFYALAIYAFAAAVAIFIEFGYLLKIGIAGNFNREILRMPGQFNDFCSFYSFGKIALSHAGTSLYDFETLQKFYAANFPGPNFASNVLYAPHFVLLFAPLCFLAPSHAFEAFMLGQYLLALTGLGFFARSCGLSWRAASLAAILSFASVPSWICVALGQSAVLMLGLLAGFFACLDQKRPIVAGLILAVIAIKPHIAAIFLILLLGKRSYKAIAAFSFALVLMLLLTSFIAGFEAVCVYPLALSSAIAHPPASFQVDSIISLVGELRRLGFYAPWLSGLILLIGMAPGVLLASKEFRNVEWSANLTVLSLLSALLFSAHVHVYDAVLLGLVALSLLSDIAGKRSMQTSKIVLAGISLLPMITWLAQFTLDKEPRDHFFVMIFFFANLLSYLLLCSSGFRESSEKPV